MHAVQSWKLTQSEACLPRSRDGKPRIRLPCAVLKGPFTLFTLYIPVSAQTLCVMDLKVGSGWIALNLGVYSI